MNARLLVYTVYLVYIYTSVPGVNICVLVVLIKVLGLAVVAAFSDCCLMVTLPMLLKISHVITILIQSSSATAGRVFFLFQTARSQAI